MVIFAYFLLLRTSEHLHFDTASGFHVASSGALYFRNTAMHVSVNAVIMNDYLDFRTYKV